MMRRNNPQIQSAYVFESQSKQWLVLSWLLIAMLLLVGCRENAATKLTDAELVERREDCLRTQNPGAAMVMACDNYERECKRRGKKTGNYIC